MSNEHNLNRSKEFEVFVLFPLTFMFVLLLVFMFAIKFTSSINNFGPLVVLLFIAWIGIFFFYRYHSKKGLFSYENSKWIINSKYIYSLITIVGTVSGLYLTLLDSPLEKMDELNIRIPSFFVAILFGFITATLSYYESKEKSK